MPTGTRDLKNLAAEQMPNAVGSISCIEVHVSDIQLAPSFLMLKVTVLIRHWLHSTTGTDGPAQTNGHSSAMITR